MLRHEVRNHGVSHLSKYSHLDFDGLRSSSDVRLLLYKTFEYTDRECKVCNHFTLP
jgi:hypothetical protein